MEKITIFQHFTKVIGHQSLPEIIEEIQGDFFKVPISKIREALNNGNKELADHLKKRLMGFTVSGKFEAGRRLEFLKTYHPFVILDLDHLREDAMRRVQSKVKTIDYSVAGFRSPSGQGYKVVVRTNATLESHRKAFDEVANYYEEKLKAEIDRSGKDVTRLCFFSYDPNAFYNENAKTFTLGQGLLDGKNIPFQLPAGDYQTALKACVQQTNAKLTFKNGNRNNYIYQLALNCFHAGIPAETTEVFCKNNFDYSNRETANTVKSAYRWKPRDKHFTLPIELPKESPPSMPVKIFDKLPSLLREGCATFKDPRERDVFLTGALGVLSGCLPETKGIYDGRIHFPNLYTFVIAPAASGKGALAYARELGLGHHQQLVSESKAAQRKYKQELIQYDSAITQHKKGKLSKPPVIPVERPFKTLFIPANSSSAMLIRQLNNNKYGGILFESEADTLGNVLKQDWGGYSDLMRKAFHHEPISYSRRLNDQFIEITNPQLSVVLSGTPSQVTNLIPSAEDGLFSRFLLYVFEVEVNWRDVSPNGKGQNFQAFYQELSQEVKSMVQYLKRHPTRFHLQQHQWIQLNEAFSASLEKTNELTGPGSLSIVKRLGGMLFRIGMILSCLRKFEEKQTTTEVYCQDEDFMAAMWMIEIYLEHSLFLYERLPKRAKSSFQFKNVRKQLFYEALPGQFQRKEAFAISHRFKMAERTAARYLKELLEAGYLTQSPEGAYGEYLKEDKMSWFINVDSRSKNYFLNRGG